MLHNYIPGVDHEAFMTGSWLRVVQCINALLKKKKKQQQQHYHKKSENIKNTLNLSMCK